MATYKYIARDIYSKTYRGKVEANSREELVALLRSKNLYLLKYKELEQEQKSDEKIAFNQEKQTELTCPRCGSSLIGATTTCPGCGIDIRSILYTK